MSYMNLVVLPVGQGSCNLIEIYEGDAPNTRGNLIYLIMADCGTDDSFYANKKELEYYDRFYYTIDYINGKMLERGRNRGKETPFLDILMLTHQDRDHWTLVNHVIDNMKYTIVSQKLFYTTMTYIDSLVDYAGNSVIQTYKVVADTGGTVTRVQLYREGSLIEGTIDEIYELDYEITREGSGGHSYEIIGMGEEWTVSICVDLDKANRCIVYSGRIDFFESEDSVTVNMHRVMSVDPAFDIFQCVKETESPGGMSEEEKFIMPGSSTFLDLAQTFLSVTLANIMSSLFDTCEEYGDGYLIGLVKSNIRENMGEVIGETIVGGYKPEFKKGFKDLCDDLEIKSNRLRYLSDISGDTIFSTIGLPTGIEIKFLCSLQSAIPDGVDLTNIQKSTKLDSKGKNDIWKNFSSLVAVITNRTGPKSVSIMITGDATVHTMHFINERILIPPCDEMLLIAPHHGSGRTSKGKISADDSDWSILETFLTKVNPYGVYISAAYESHHGHPNHTFVDASLERVQGKNTEHYLYYCTSPEGKGKFALHPTEIFVRTNVEEDGTVLCHRYNAYVQNDDLSYRVEAGSYEGIQDIPAGGGPIYFATKEQEVELPNTKDLTFLEYRY